MFLSQIERKIIPFLADRKKVEELARESGLSFTETMRALQWLENKGLAKISKKEEERYVHTEKGRKYVGKKLPERAILDSLKESPKSINELPVSKEEFSGVIGILKREGLVEFDGNTLKITDKGKKHVFPWESKYDSLEIEEEFLEILRIRGLVKKEKTAIWYAEPTEELKKIEIKEEEIIERVTPDVLKSGEWKKKKIKPYDVVSPVPKEYFGKMHPYAEFLTKVKQKLYALGFKEEPRGEIVLPMFWNSTALFMPVDHPASDIHDIYFVKEPKKYGSIDEEIYEKVKNVHERTWGQWDEEKVKRLVLRSHATALSAWALYVKPKIPGKYFTISRVYRPDEFDAKHLLEFNQLDGIVLGEEITFRDLLGILKTMAEEFAHAERVKFKAGYFPFTEPSVELFVEHPKLGWIEVGGAGIFREELLEPFGINVPVIAWGLGIDRLAMVLLEIDDIRYLFSKDLGWLRKKGKIWRV